MTTTDCWNSIYSAIYVCAFVILSIIHLFIRVLNKRLVPATQSTRMKAGFRVGSSFLKRHLLYAPLFRFKRATYLTLWKGKIVLGVLPSRVQTLLLFLVLGTNVFLTFWNLPYSSDSYKLLIALADRSGTVAIANFIPIVITANHQNPLIYLLDLPFDSFILFHRWVARLTLVEIILHGVTHAVAPGVKHGWADARYQLIHVLHIRDGLVAGILITLVVLFAVKPIRVMAYDIFHYSHILLLIPTFALIYVHLPDHPQRWFVVTAAALWGVQRLMWFLLTIYRSFGTSRSSAYFEELPEGATRILVDVPRNWTFKAGQSLRLALPDLDWTGAHPFSIIWTDKRGDTSENKLEDEESADVEPVSSLGSACGKGKQTLHLIVKKQHGLTKKLHERAMTVGEDGDCQKSRLRAWVSGPDGKQQDLYWYDNVLLVAGGVGITYQVPYVYSLLQKRLKGQRAPSRIHLVWTAQSVDVVTWVKPCLGAIEELRRSTNADVVLRLYVTRQDSDTLPQTVDGFQIHQGRPDLCDVIKTLVNGELAKKSYISVCGSAGLSDDLRRSVRQSLRTGADLAFYEEGFSW